MRARPFRAPHHTTSEAALVGGGSNPRPGEISLAHNGVLFLDELPEFSRGVLESLRQPLEEGRVTVSRAARTVSFPARFMLVGAMNPCPCGFQGDDTRRCRCSSGQLARYAARISGPLRDRLDLFVEVPSAVLEIHERQPEESSQAIAVRVTGARRRQADRFAGPRLNASMATADLRHQCGLDRRGASLLKKAVQKLTVSARGHDRVLRVSRTIADLDECADIQAEHLAEALQYRAIGPSTM